MIGSCFVLRLFRRLSSTRAGRLISSSLRWPSSKVWTHVCGVRFIAWRVRRQFLGECLRGPAAFLVPQDASGPLSYTRTHLKKALCHTRPSCGTFHKYSLISSCFVQRVVSRLSNIRAGRFISLNPQVAVSPGFNSHWCG